jgi:hypothetical protein
MFNSWMFYVILALSASTAALGWLSLSLHDDKVVAVEALKEAREAVAGYQKALNLKYLSCDIDTASAVEVEADKKYLQNKTDDISTKLEKLRSPVAVKHEIIKNESLKETNVLPDDGLLSANIVSLLKQGYCSVYPTDSECVPK